MMLQMDLTAPLIYCLVVSFFPLPLLLLFNFAIEIASGGYSSGRSKAL